MNTKISVTPAPDFTRSRSHVPTWAAPRSQGSGVSASASQLAGTAMTVATCTAAANAAKGATRKDATGGGAFEDPV